MVALEWPDGKRADAAEPLRLADRGVPPNAIEAPYIVEHDGDYFLFVSFDSCCKALGSTYHVMVGRADEVTGPYLDRDGVPLLEGGGTSVLEGDGGVHIGPGGQSVGGRNARRALLRRPLQRRLPARPAPARLGRRRLADRPLVTDVRVRGLRASARARPWSLSERSETKRSRRWRSSLRDRIDVLAWQAELGRRFPVAERHFDSLRSLGVGSPRDEAAPAARCAPLRLVAALRSGTVPGHTPGAPSPSPNEAATRVRPRRGRRRRPRAPPPAPRRGAPGRAATPRRACRRPRCRTGAPRTRRARSAP